MAKSKFFISLQSFNSKILNQSCKKLVEIFSQPENSRNISFKGPIPFPTHRRIYCVLRSPHINKDSREQFEIRRYKRLLEVFSDSSKQVENLLKLNSIGEGIEVQIILLKKNKKKLMKIK
jgi:small subunit ribosomal protein S10